MLPHRAGDKDPTADGLPAGQELGDVRAAAQEEGHGEEEVGWPAWVEALVGVAGRWGDVALAGGQGGGAGWGEGVVGLTLLS